MTSSPQLFGKVLNPDLGKFHTVKQPCFVSLKSQKSQTSIYESGSTDNTDSKLYKPISAINQTVITIQTFKDMKEQCIISTCYVQNDSKFSCNYIYDKKDFKSFEKIPLKIKTTFSNIQSSSLNGESQSQQIIQPVQRRLVKKEEQIPKSKNAAKNITKAFVRYLREKHGEDDKNYKDLVRFVNNHKFNNKNLKCIAQKPVFALEFEQFCDGLAQKWVHSCEIQDKEMHLRILDAFMNKDYEMLKEHKKRSKKRFSL